MGSALTAADGAQADYDVKNLKGNEKPDQRRLDRILAGQRRWAVRRNCCSGGDRQIEVEHHQQLTARVRPGAGPPWADHGGEMSLDDVVAFACAALEAGPVGHPHDPASDCDQAFVLKRADHGVDRGALHAEQPRQRLLRQLDSSPARSCAMQQPARRSLNDRMEGVARAGLHHLRKQIVRESAEQVGDERRASFASSSVAIGTFSAWPPTRTTAREKAGAWPQLTIPPIAPSRPIERPRPSGRPTGRDQRHHRRPEREQARVHRPPRVSTVSSGASSTISPYGSISARASGKKSTASGCRQMPGPRDRVHRRQVGHVPNNPQMGVPLHRRYIRIGST